MSRGRALLFAWPRAWHFLEAFRRERARQSPCTRAQARQWHAVAMATRSSSDICTPYFIVLSRDKGALLQSIYDLWRSKVICICFGSTRWWLPGQSDEMKRGLEGNGGRIARGYLDDKLRVAHVTAGSSSGAKSADMVARSQP